MEVDAAPFAELLEAKGRCVELPGHSLALFRLGDQVFALDNACPHRGGPLCEGDVDSTLGVVYCPLHAWGFDLRTGEGTNIKRTRTDTFPARVVEGRVLVTLPMPWAFPTDGDDDG